MVQLADSFIGSPVQVLHAHDATVTVPDAHTMFAGNYAHQATDLLITDDAGKSFLIADYFSDLGNPALVSPTGARLSPEVVSALAGSLAPGQYAAAGDAQGQPAIGRIASLTGTATVQHADGTVADLHTNTPVAANDVVRTGRTVTIVFNDGTVFIFPLMREWPSIASSTRKVEVPTRCRSVLSRELSPLLRARSRRRVR